MSSSDYAAFPFDHPKADIILRSSDNVHFRVFKLFLSLASSFFETLFDLPQPDGIGDQETKDGVIVIPVSEDAKTLDTLLRFCYPCTLTEDPCLDRLEDLTSVLEAAKKYSLDAIERKVRQTICNPKILQVKALRCFAIARHGQLENEALLAARYSLNQPLIPAWFEEINLITATDLLELLTYHKRCGDVVQELKRDISWIKSHYGSAAACSWLCGYYTEPGHSSTTNCRCARSENTRYRLFNFTVLLWWHEFMENTFLALQDKPCSATIDHMAEETVQKVRQTSCRACSDKVAEGMRGFSELFKRKVDELVSRVPLSRLPQPR